MKRILFTIAALGLFSTAVIAASQTPTSSTKGTPYIGLQLGIGGMQTGTSDPVGYDVTVGGLTYRIFGGYLFNLTPYFKLGPEVGYMGYPNNTYKLNTTSPSTTVYEYSGSTIDVLADARWYIDEAFYFEGKLGAAFVSQELKLLGSKKSKSALLPKVALGIGYNFTPHFGMSLGFSTTSGAEPGPLGDDDGNLDDVARVASFSVGANYLF